MLDGNNRLTLPFDYHLKSYLSIIILKKRCVYKINMKLGGVIIYEYLGDEDGDEILCQITSLTYKDYNIFIDDIKTKLRNHVIDNVLS